jgi:2-methylaconitate cis-trans-isomerase PrpF
MQVKIPCVLMRGGTSRGPFFHAADLPADVPTRDRVLLAAMGSPHPLQVDGIGGGHPLTSKVAIIDRSSDPRADVDYLFAQVLVDRAIVDTSPNCGNMLAGVGPFAIESGLVEASVGETRVRILNRNTGALIEAFVQTPDGHVEYAGDARIDGAPGTAAPIRLNFLAAVGSKTGALFPTGLRRETIEGIAVTLIDYAMPMMLLAADCVGIAGTESPTELNAMQPLLRRLESARLEAGRRMGLGDVSNLVVPKIGVLSPPTSGTITSRYFVPDRCHASHAATGALCVAAATRIPGTIAWDLARRDSGSAAVIEHPSGQFALDMDVDFVANEAAGQPDTPVIRRAALIRTARRIFEGNLLVPASAWPARAVA